MVDMSNFGGADPAGSMLKGSMAANQMIGAFGQGMEDSEKMKKINRAERLRAVMQSMDPNNLDFSKIAEVEPEFAQNLMNLVQERQSGGMRLQAQETKLYQEVAGEIMGAYEQVVNSGAPDSPELRQRIMAAAKDRLKERGIGEEKLPRTDSPQAWDAWMGIARQGGYVPMQEQIRLAQEKQRAMLPFMQAQAGIGIDAYRQKSDIGVEAARQKMQYQANILGRPGENTMRGNAQLATPQGEEADEQGVYPSDYVEAERWLNEGGQMAPGSGVLGNITRTRVRKAVGKLMRDRGISMKDVLQHRMQYAGAKGAYTKGAQMTHGVHAQVLPAREQVPDLFEIQGALGLSEAPALNSGILTYQREVGGMIGGGKKVNIRNPMAGERPGEQELSSPELVQAYLGRLHAVRVDMARMLENNYGNQAPTDASMEQAKQMIPDNITPKQLKQTIERVFLPEVERRYRGLAEEQGNIIREMGQTPVTRTTPEVTPEVTPEAGDMSEESIKQMYESGQIDDAQAAQLLRELHGYQ